MDDMIRLQASDIHVRNLSAAEISAYQRDGVVHLPALVDAATCACLLSAADHRLDEFRREKRNQYASNMAKDGTFFSERECYKWNAALNDFVMTSRMAEIAYGATQRIGTVRAGLRQIKIVDKRLTTPDCVQRPRRPGSLIAVQELGKRVGYPINGGCSEPLPVASPEDRARSIAKACGLF